MNVVFCIRLSSCRIRLSTNKVYAKNVIICISVYNKNITVRKRTVRVRIRTVFALVTYVSLVVFCKLKTKSEKLKI